METGSVRAACVSATAAALLFAPLVHAAPGDNGADAPPHIAPPNHAPPNHAPPNHAPQKYTLDHSTAHGTTTTATIPHKRDVLPLLAAMQKSDGSNRDTLVKLSAMLERIIDSNHDLDSNDVDAMRQPATYERAVLRSDSQKQETKVATLAAASGSTAYMDGIFNVGPGWRTMTMPDGSKCGAGCNEVKWNYMTTDGKRGAAAAAGAWMDAHDTPDAVLYTFSGSAVGAQDARALRPDWQGKIIQLGSPARPNNGATYEQGGRPALDVGGGSIEYVSTKSDEAAVRRKWYGNHTFGYGGRDFSKETPVSQTQYGDNVIDRVYADPPIRASWLTDLFTPKPSAQKVSGGDYVGRHRLDETSTERGQVTKGQVTKGQVTKGQVVKNIADEVKKLTSRKSTTETTKSETTKKRKTTSVSAGSASRSSGESSSDTGSDD